MERSNICAYCGESQEIEREHVIPAVFYTVRSFNPYLQWIVPACRICNGLAGSRLFFSIPEKAEYLKKRYKIRYKKLLKMGYWSEEELSDMGYALRKGIEQSLLMRVCVLRRIKQLELTSEYSRDYLRPEWVKREYEKYLEEIASSKKKFVRFFTTEGSTL